mmetsp:Transcript_13121/g.41508  ORF Transcript_13121/g.41508 Transcript_13121/m.41508 type:complete len:229 (-) Transcript_13121:651-1337(-)
MLSWRTRPPSAPPISCATTTARWWSRTSGVTGGSWGLGARGGRLAGAAALGASLGATGMAAAAAASSSAALTSTLVAPSSTWLARRLSSHVRQLEALGSPTISPGAPPESSATSMSSRRTPPRRPPYMNTNFPTAATAWRHRREGSPSVASLRASAPHHTPAAVSSTVIAAESSTMRPPPRAPPLTCSLASTNTAACWYRALGATPGAAAHSHRPSLCRARPYASPRG